MIWFGVRMMSQWEIDEPGWTGFGDQSSAFPDAGLVPARRERSRLSEMLTPPASCDLIVLPSASVMRPDGIVIVGSAPPRPAGGEPATLSAMRAAIAPAFCMFFTLTTNVQVPRSASPTNPVRLPAGSA